VEKCGQQICPCRVSEDTIAKAYVDMWGSDTVLTLEEEKDLEPLMKIMRSFDKQPKERGHSE